MATFTTKITPGKIERELTFNGEVFRERVWRYGVSVEGILEQIKSRYPDNGNLHRLIPFLGREANGYQDMELLAELQAIEDEYASKEATPCTNN